MEKELKYLKVGNIEFKQKEGDLCIRKEIFPGHPSWYIAEVKDIAEAIQATREETMKDVLKVMVDWAFRKYSSRKVLAEVSRYINTEIKLLKSKNDKD